MRNIYKLALFYGSLDPVLSVSTVIGLWVQGPFRTYSYYTTIIANKKAHVSKFGVLLFPKTAVSLGRMISLYQDPVLYLYHQ